MSSFAISDIATFTSVGIGLGLLAHAVGWSFYFIVRKLSALVTSV